MRVEDVDIQVVGAGRGFSWLVEGFQFFAHHPGTWMGIVVIWFLMAMAINFIPAGSFAFYVIQPIFWGGLMLGCHAQEHGDELELNHLFMGFRDHSGPLAGAGGIYLGATLVITVAMIIAGIGLVAGSGIDVVELIEGVEAAAEYQDLPPSVATLVLIVCLVTLFASALFMLVLMAFWFAPALIVLDGVALGDSIRLSFFGCLRNWLPFLVYGLVLLVIGTLAAVPMMLGYLIVGPMFVASVHRAYRDIYVSSAPAEAASTPA